MGRARFLITNILKAKHDQLLLFSREKKCISFGSTAVSLEMPYSLVELISTGCILVQQGQNWWIAIGERMPT